MTDLMIECCAYRAWKATIIERRRNGALSIDNILMTNVIQRLRGDPGLYVRFDHLQDLRRQTTGHTHLVDFFS